MLYEPPISCVASSVAKRRRDDAPNYFTRPRNWTGSKRNDAIWKFSGRMMQLQAITTGTAAQITTLGAIDKVVAPIGKRSTMRSDEVACLLSAVGYRLAQPPIRPRLFQVLFVSHFMQKGVSSKLINVKFSYKCRLLRSRQLFEHGKRSASARCGRQDRNLDLAILSQDGSRAGCRCAVAAPGGLSLP